MNGASSEKARDINRLFMMPHLVRAQSTYKDMDIYMLISFTYIHTQMIDFATLKVVKSKHYFYVDV